MTDRRHVVLIGPMAVGKSTVGPALARLMDRPFADADDLVRAEHGPIPEIFRDHSEAQFRRWEADAIAQALAGRVPIVLSLGGGAPLHPGTAALLQSHRVVLLTIDAESVAKRLRNQGQRPLLDRGVDAAMSPAQQQRARSEGWFEIAQERLPHYRKLATVEVDVSGGAPAQCAVEILTALNRVRMNEPHKQEVSDI